MTDGTLTPVGTLTPDSGPITTESVPLQWAMERTDCLQLVLTGSDETSSVMLEFID